MNDKEKNLEIRISLVGAEEVIEQLKTIKKILSDIKSKFNDAPAIKVNNDSKYRTPLENAIKFENEKRN